MSRMNSACVRNKHGRNCLVCVTLSRCSQESRLPEGSLCVLMISGVSFGSPSPRGDAWDHQISEQLEQSVHEDCREEEVPRTPSNDIRENTEGHQTVALVSSSTVRLTWKRRDSFHGSIQDLQTFRKRDRTFQVTGREYQSNSDRVCVNRAQICLLRVKW